MWCLFEESVSLSSDKSTVQDSYRTEVSIGSAKPVESEVVTAGREDKSDQLDLNGSLSEFPHTKGTRRVVEMTEPA